MLNYQLLLLQHQLRIHRALGAPPAALLRLLLRRYLLPVAAGATIGMLTMYLCIAQHWQAELLGSLIGPTFFIDWFQQRCLRVATALLTLGILLLIRQNRRLHQHSVQQLSC